MILYVSANIQGVVVHIGQIFYSFTLYNNGIQTCIYWINREYPWWQDWFIISPKLTIFQICFNEKQISSKDSSLYASRISWAKTFRKNLTRL